MTVSEITQELKAAGYRVVPEYSHVWHRWEIIIEPWDWERGKRIPGRKVKRTGRFFSADECKFGKTSSTGYARSLLEVQLKLIDHLKNKKPVRETIFG